MTATPPPTASAAYTERLAAAIPHRGWRRWIDVQRPYRWNIRRLQPGFVLEVGCGVGRMLGHLDGHGVGVDWNPHSVAVANARGLTAFTPDDFERSPHAVPGRFDSLLLSHVAEHMTPVELDALLRRHARHVRDGGRLILMCPQERGYRADPTHVHFMDFAALQAAASRAGFVPERSFSFPFPRWAGRMFTHNEFVVVARRRVPEPASRS